MTAGDEQFYNEPRRRRPRHAGDDNYAHQGTRELYRNARKEARPALAGAKLIELLSQRPKTRADCARVPRPCPFVGCRYNLALEITHNGGLKFAMVDHDGQLTQGVNNCALDHANEGPMTLDQVAGFFGLTRERIRQQEVVALSRLRQLESLDEAAPGFDVRERLDASEEEQEEEVADEEPRWC